MKIIEIQEQIKKELKINKTKLDEEASTNPLKLQQYIDLLLKQQAKLMKIESNFKKLYREKYIFYSNDWDYKLGTQTELKLIVDGDDEIRQLQLAIQEQISLIKYLEKTIDNFKGRGFAIKNMIDFIKFMAGE